MINNNILVQMLLYIYDLDSFEVGEDNRDFRYIIAEMLYKELGRIEVYREYSKQTKIRDFSSGYIDGIKTKILNMLGRNKIACRMSLKIVGSDFNILVKHGINIGLKYNSKLKYYYDMYSEVPDEIEYDRSCVNSTDSEYRTVGKLALLFIDLENIANKDLEWYIWQEFIAKWFMRNTKYNVQEQVKIVSGKIEARPDIILDKHIILDAKHKRNKDSNVDVYQMHYYITKYAGADFGVLVYSNDSTKDIDEIDNQIFVKYIGVKDSFKDILASMTTFNREIKEVRDVNGWK